MSELAVCRVWSRESCLHSSIELMRVRRHMLGGGGGVTLRSLALLEIGSNGNVLTALTVFQRWITRLRRNSGSLAPRPRRL